MLLTISTTHPAATDLGYLLHKNPDRFQTFEASFGKLHVFYPEATEKVCTAALLLDVDPISLVRGRKGVTLDQYVNDRAYAVSSFMSVAISKVFGTALAGRSKDRPELVETPIALTARLAALPCRGGEELLRRLFEPLGYEVTTHQEMLDERFPAWGPSPYFSVQLHAERRLSDLLSHLYVLIPVLDDQKHYWVGEDEIDKLLRHGERWLADHPAREEIVRRYLRHRRSLTRAALARLVSEEDPELDESEEGRDLEEAKVEKPMRLSEQRIGAVMAALKGSGARRVVDLGCGEGRLLAALLKERDFEEIVGLDVSYRALDMAQRRLRLDQLAPMQRERVRLIHGSLMYRDRRIEGYDAAALVEVVEHLDPARLVVLRRVVFEFARPRVLIVTTPNREYNVKFERLPAGTLRHRDHQFEWTREEFRHWASEVAEQFGYQVDFLPVGPEDADVGPPTQMGVFQR